MTTKAEYDEEKLAKKLYKEFVGEFILDFNEVLTVNKLERKINIPEYMKWLDNKGYNEGDDEDLYQIFEMYIYEDLPQEEEFPDYVESSIKLDYFIESGTITKGDFYKIINGRSLESGIKLHKHNPVRMKKVETGKFEYEVDLEVGDKMYRLTYQEVDNGWENYYVFNEYPKLKM